MSIIDTHLIEFNKAVEHFRTEIGGLKTGRANPALLDSVRVEAYGVLNPISAVASVTIADARSLVVTPWDKSITKDLEKGIIEANLNLNPMNEGDKIRINLPVLTEESRKELVKVLNAKSEAAKIEIRQIRDDIKEEVIAAEKAKDFGEDEKFRLLEELDKKVSGFNEQIKELVRTKEEEIMTV